MENEPFKQQKLKML